MKSFELQLEQISKLSETAMKDAQSRWDHVAKPLHSLGLLEDALVRIAGIQGNQSDQSYETGIGDHVRG